VELRPYVERLHADLSNVAAAAGPDVTTAADRLLPALEPAVRIALMEALADAAAEITQELERVAVEVRLRGSEPQFVVVPTAAAWDEHGVGPAAAEALEDAGEPSARLTVRLSERLKTTAEQAANAAGLSLNSWIVDAVRAATGKPTDRAAPAPGRSVRNRRRVQGWAR
jgi:hypothetical protein